MVLKYILFRTLQRLQPFGKKMSYLLPHLNKEDEVTNLLQSVEERVVVIRWGTDSDPTCTVMDETLYKIARLVKNFPVIYLVDITQVTAFNEHFKLTDPCSVMLFHRDKHIMVDMGTGNNNKIVFPSSASQDLIEIIEVVYRGARKGKGLVTAPRDYSTKYQY